MRPEESAYVQQWMSKGHADLIVAKMIIDQNTAVLDVACFHCQQAVEKFLKAFLVSKREDFPKTHNLDYLKVLCIHHDTGFAQFDVGDFENYAVRNRYPHDNHQPELHAANRLYMIADELQVFVQGLIFGV